MWCVEGKPESKLSSLIQLPFQTFVSGFSFIYLSLQLFHFHFTVSYCAHKECHPRAFCSFNMFNLNTEIIGFSCHLHHYQHSLITVSVLFASLWDTDTTSTNHCYGGQKSGGALRQLWHYWRSLHTVSILSFCLRETDTTGLISARETKCPAEVSRGMARQLLLLHYDNGWLCNCPGVRLAKNNIGFWKQLSINNIEANCKKNYLHK